MEQGLLEIDDGLEATWTSSGLISMLHLLLVASASFPLLSFFVFIFLFFSYSFFIKAQRGRERTTLWQG